MKKTFTISALPGLSRKKTLCFARFALLFAMVQVFVGNAYSQISLPNTTAVTENFDGMGTTTGATTLTLGTLNSNWKVQNNAAPTWAGGTFNVGQQASTGTPAAGAFYNWGTSATERALGVMTSGGFTSPNSVMAWYRNTNAANLISLTIAYDLERYRINSVAASLQFYYSTNGTTWTAVAAGDIAAAALPTGSSAYDFTAAGTPSSTVCGKISKSGISITGLNIATNGNIYLRWNLATGGANSQGIGIDNVSVVAGFAAPSIVLSDNALSGFTYMFGAGPSPAQFFTIAGTSLTPTNAALSIAPPASGNYEISFAAAGPYISSGSLTTLNASGGTFPATAVYVRLKAGLAINTYNGETITCSGGGASNETVTCNGTVTNFFNSSSDVVAVAASEPATLSSLQLTNPPLTIATGNQVWAFTIRDGGGVADADNLPTIVNSISIIGLAGDGNSVSDWSTAIRTVSLFDQATGTLLATGTVSASQIDFTGMSFSVPDDQVRNVTMRLSFKCGIGGANSDGDDFVFRITNANFTTASSSTSSQKSAFPAAVSTNGRNVISVIATRLIYTQQPQSNVSINNNFSPAVTVTATDACGNIDKGFAGTIDITSSGTLLSSPQSSIASGGIASFSGISHIAAGGPFNLTAASTGLISAVSNPFNVTLSTTLGSGDLMIVGFDTYVTSGSDLVSIANFVPILPTTTFTIANAVYDWLAPAGVRQDRWYNGNSAGAPFSVGVPFAKFTYNGTGNITAGSIICITVTGSGIISGITVNGVNRYADFNVANATGGDGKTVSTNIAISSADPDAWFLMQGDFNPLFTDASDGTNLYRTFNGVVFGGLQTKGSFQPGSLAGNAGGARISRVHPNVECLAISTGTAGTNNGFYGYYNSGSLHNGSHRNLMKAIAAYSGSNWTKGNPGNVDGNNLSGDATCTNQFTVTSNVSPGLWAGDVSTDWFDCNNWDDYNVPTSATDVLITNSAVNNAQISYLSPKAAQFNNAGDAKSLNIIGKQLIIQYTAPGAIVNRLNVAGSLTINTINGLDMNDGVAGTVDGTINLTGSWVNNFSNGFDYGESLVNFNGTSGQGLTAIDGETFYNFTNSNTGGGVVLANTNTNITVNNIFSLSNGIFTINQNTLILNGTATGSGTITGSNNSNLIIGGTAGGALGTLNFTAGSRLLNNITMNRTGAGATATLGTDLAINTLATITAGTLNAQTNSFSGAGGLTMTGGELQVGRAGVTSPELSGTYSLTGGVVNFTSTAPNSQTIRAVNYYDLTSTSTGPRVMANSGTIGIANLFTKGSNAYTFTGSTVDYNGTGANQNITPFTAAAAPGSTYDNLTLSNSLNTVTSKTLTGATDVEGDLTLNNSISLKLGANYLTLKSTAGKTARVAPVSGTASIDYSLGVGRFVVERYYPGRRKWRMITAPVTVDATNAVFNAWQLGGAAPVGSGTYVTGPSPTGAGGNGLDVSPQNNYSLKTYNTLTNVWDGVSNTKTARISGTAGGAGLPDNIGYFMFVRGDRTAANVNAFNPYGAVLETTLRDTGKIQVQSYDFPGNPVVGQFAVVGNPYASPVDFGSVFMGKSGIANKFYAWDPGINGSNGVGGYVIVDMAGPSVTTVPVGQSGVSQTQIIQSKQAILIESDNSLPTHSLTFNEGAKSSLNNLNLFRPSPNPLASVAVNLHATMGDGEFVLSDGVLAQFGNEYSDGLDQLDSRKFTNINETFSILHSGNYYMLERRKPVKANDTIFLSLNRARQLPYRFNIMLNNMASSRLTAYLVDTYLNRSTPVNMDGSTWVDFAVTNTASAAAGRFYIVFKKMFACKSIAATQVGSDVAVQWVMQEENGVQLYEVERSKDGVAFEKVGVLDAAKGSGNLNSYLLTDFDVAPGIYYYRVKAVSNSSGTSDYTEAVKVKVAKNSGGLYVYPNPVTDKMIGLKMDAAMPSGKYAVRLINSNGQVVLSTNLQHTKSSVTQTINCPASTAIGTYQLEVTSPDKKKTVINVVIAN